MFFLKYPLQKLFEESLNIVYNEEMKNVILQRAQMIASHFQNMLYKYGGH